MKLLYILLFIALPLAIFAQTNYHEGYVLKNNGDTLKGYIDYREWNVSPISVDFKVNKNDHVLQFSPQTIKEFQITGMDTYVSYTGMISMNRTRFPDLPVGSDTSKKIGTIFLKKVTTGSFITLFYQNDNRKLRFFIAETNENPVELKYYQYYTNARDIIERPLYKGQLIFYINKFNAGNSRLMSKAESVNYEETDLEHLVNEINNKGDYKADNKNRKSNMRLFAGVGVNFTKTRYSNGNFTLVSFSSVNNQGFATVNKTPYTISSTSRTVAPKINFGFDAFVNPNVQQFIFRAELSLSFVGANFRYPIITNSITTYDDYTFNQFTASLTPQLLFNVYNKDDFKFYIDGGIAFNLAAYSNNEITDPNTGAKDPNQHPYHLEPYWASFPLQVGAVLNKKIEISFTYNSFAVFTKYSDISVANQSFNLGVKLLLDSK